MLLQILTGIGINIYVLAYLRVRCLLDESCVEMTRVESGDHHLLGTLVFLRACANHKQ
jgi:hypothetical protein